MRGVWARGPIRVVTAHVQDSKLASGPIALQYAVGIVKFLKVEIAEL